jgi:hypothetical protein
VQDEVVVTVRVAGVAPAVTVDAQLDYEREAYVSSRWWRPEDLPAAERYYPGRLVEFLPAFLAGEPIEEPFETWS